MDREMEWWTDDAWDKRDGDSHNDKDAATEDFILEKIELCLEKGIPVRSIDLTYEENTKLFS